MARNFGNATSDILLNTSCVSPGNAGTIACHFKPAFSSGASNPMWLGGYRKTPATTGNLDFVQHFSDNNIYLGWEGGGGGNQRLVVADTGCFSTGVWAHHALTWNTVGTTTTYYINASQKGTTASFPTSTFTCDVMMIGNLHTANSSANGAICDFCSWNVVLTLSEIAALSSGIRPHRIRPAAIISYCPIDGLQSPEPDLSSNAKNMTLTGTTAAIGAPITMFTPRWRTTRYIEAPSFIPAWAQQANLPVLGAGTF